MVINDHKIKPYQRRVRIIGIVLALTVNWYFADYNCVLPKIRRVDFLFFLRINSQLPNPLIVVNFFQEIIFYLRTKNEMVAKEIWMLLLLKLIL